MVSYNCNIFLVNNLDIISKIYLESNCTGNCVESFRRKWPKFDFEFYYDQQNHSTIENESFVDFPYSLIDQLSSESTPKIIETITTTTTTTTTIKPSSPTISNIYNQTGKNYSLSFLLPD